jgi:nucleotide-binding universal stress UspA family protein
MYYRILLALDGSELAERAIPHAVDLARAMDARLILLRVVPVSAARGEPDAPQRAAVAVLTPVEQLVMAERREAETYLERQAMTLRASGLEVECVCRTGCIAPTILAVAEDFRAELLVLATHGRSGPGGHAYVSVASDVLRRAKVPVLLVRVGYPGGASELQGQIPARGDHPVIALRSEAHPWEPEHTHLANTHAHDHYHLAHHRHSADGAWEHRESWHSHEHDHGAVTHRHRCREADEEGLHCREAHAHDHPSVRAIHPH